MAKLKLSEELKWRGFVNQTTYKDLSILDKKPITFYWGVDPSASSMTVGHLAIAIMIRHFIDAGHKPILLVGGATGLIGDPDGKAQERDLKTYEEIEKNKLGIKKQYEKIFAGQQVEMVDNYAWFKSMNFLEFLRDIGKHVPMRQMLARDFVQSRLGEEGAGISYAEFSYSLIQGYDFLHLFKEKNVTLQVCGADQWGNSVTGVDLIRRIEGKEANVWSAPLVINQSTGVKFGKTEEGAVWLDENLTSVYKFYQFWLNTDDEGVEDYLKKYTFIDQNELAELMEGFNKDKSSRSAQKYLAYNVTKIVHGESRTDSVKNISEVLFGGKNYQTLSREDFINLSKEIGLYEISDNLDILDVLIKTCLASSKSEARRLIESKSIYINGEQMPVEKQTINVSDTINGCAVLRRGKNASAVIKVT